MKSDIEIARETDLRKIKEVATTLGIPREEVQNYGRYIAKVPIHLIDKKQMDQHNLILVTAITPTKAGIGKTTVSIGLALGLNKIGKKAVVALREPSLGPCFGMKGGAAGGGPGRIRRKGSRLCRQSAAHVNDNQHYQRFPYRCTRLFLRKTVVDSYGHDGSANRLRNNLH